MLSPEALTIAPIVTAWTGLLLGIVNTRTPSVIHGSHRMQVVAPSGASASLDGHLDFPDLSTIENILHGAQVFPGGNFDVGVRLDLRFTCEQQPGRSGTHTL